METKTILFPSSYFTIREVDEELKKEYDAAVNTGLWDIILFSYDKWFNEGKLVLDRQPEELCSAVYRGWMMKPEMYEDFYYQLILNKIKLITLPDNYRTFHIFPNIYPRIHEDTAQIKVYPDGNVDLEDVKKHFSRFMVKDYVKSVKGTSFPKYFDSSISEEEFSEQMKIFHKYRGELYTGGICVKEFLTLKYYGDNTNEYRVFYINNEIASVSRNSGQKDNAPPPPQKLLEKYQHLDSLYYTIDYAELENGDWKIIEAGDGQVSGLSDMQDHNAYFRALYYSLNSK